MDAPSLRYCAQLSRILFKDYQSFLLLLLTVASILFVVTIPLLLRVAYNPKRPKQAFLPTLYGDLVEN